jgi:hypothetical protein
MIRDCVLTLDLDWAPDAVVDDVAALLLERGIPATWFITHASPSVERLRDHPELFELGIHPNFLAGSTHGATPEEILDHCMRLVPEARSMRTHSLVQSTPLLAEAMARTPIVVDVSLFLPRARGLEPVEYRWGESRLLRLPYFWEDDMEMTDDDPSPLLDADLFEAPGLKVFDFHPVHVYLNTNNMDAYRRLTASVPSLERASVEALEPYRSNGAGTRTAFIDLVDRIAEERRGQRVIDVYQSWAKRR